MEPDDEEELLAGLAGSAAAAQQPARARGWTKRARPEKPAFSKFLTAGEDAGPFCFWRPGAVTGAQIGLARGGRRRDMLDQRKAKSATAVAGLNIGQ